MSLSDPTSDFQNNAAPLVEQGPLGRIIRPADGDELLLDGRSFNLENVDDLLRALQLQSRGKLEKLQQATTELETRLRRYAADGRRRIDDALELARSSIERRIGETAKRSQEILEERRREGFEAGRQDGYRQGYEEGLEIALKNGREDAYQEAGERLREETATAAAMIVALADELDERWRRSFDDARRDLLRLAVRIAERIVRHEVRNDPSKITGSISIAIDRIAEDHALVIELHPRDRAVVEEFLGTISERLSRVPEVSIQDCPQISPGGCRVNAGCSVVDFTIESQLEIIERRLLETEGVR